MAEFYTEIPPPHTNTSDLGLDESLSTTSMNTNSSTHSEAGVINLIESSRKTLQDAAGNQVTEIQSADTIIILKDKFADGAYSDVFRATWEKPKDGVQLQVAIKQLRFNGINTVTTGTGAIEGDLTRIDKRLGREMYNWRRLSDACLPPGVSYVTPLLGYVKSTNHALGGDYPCLISLYRKNGSLPIFLKANPNVDRVRLLVAAAEALNFLHTFDPPIAHMDISPKNILINDDERPEFCDFGLAKALEDVRTGFTTTSKSAGTTGYCSPQMLDPEGADGAVNAALLKPDIYSFGGIVLFVLSGNHPWYNKKTLAQIVLQIVSQKTPAEKDHPITGSPAFKEAMWALMRKCWAYRPEDRPTTGEILRELQRIQTSLA